jgi:hypothetical protein
VLEVAIIRDTINHYSPVLIATLSNQFPRAGVQKKRAHRRRGHTDDGEPQLGKSDSVSAEGHAGSEQASGIIIDGLGQEQVSSVHQDIYVPFGKGAICGRPAHDQLGEFIQ